jgi:hypothetical protein
VTTLSVKGDDPVRGGSPPSIGSGEDPPDDPYVVRDRPDPVGRAGRVRLWAQLRQPSRHLADHRRIVDFDDLGEHDDGVRADHGADDAWPGHAAADGTTATSAAADATADATSDAASNGAAAAHDAAPDDRRDLRRGGR